MLGKDLVRVHIVGKDSEWDFLLKHLNASASHSNFVVANKNKIWMTPTATGQTFKWKDSVVTCCDVMHRNDSEPLGESTGQSFRRASVECQYLQVLHHPTF